jgi:general secretion pathway protein K
MRHERGFALIAALWLVVALSALALEVSLVARERRLAAANTVEGTQGRAAADAGLEHARARLAGMLERGALDPWRRVDSVLAQAVALGDARYRVTLRDAGSALNVNRASEAELRRLLVALRVDAGLADRLAQTIADWRDPDDLRRARGAEREEYLRAGRPVLPRNGPFQSIAELGSVLGMTPEILELIRPHLTLLGTGQVNLNAAPRPVLLALPGIGEEAAGVLLRRQNGARPLRSLAELSLELSSGARAVLQAETSALLARATFETREVEAVSDGWVDGSPVRVHAQGLLVRARDVAFLVWRRTQ